jgi:hypothetical protein
MSGSRYIQTWRDAAHALELNVTPWRVVLLPSAKCLVADLWIEGFGSPRGMLLFGRAVQVDSHAAELQREGWAHAVLDDEYDAQPSHEQIMQRLREWGWRGSPERMPGWLIGV